MQMILNWQCYYGFIVFNRIDLVNNKSHCLKQQLGLKVDDMGIK